MSFPFMSFAWMSSAAVDQRTADPYAYTFANWRITAATQRMRYLEDDRLRVGMKCAVT